MMNPSTLSGRRFVGRPHVAVIAALLALHPLVTLAQEPAAPEPKIEAKEKKGSTLTPGQIAVDRKLDAIIIPQVDLENTIFDEAVDFFRLRSAELDHTEPKPHLAGLNIVVFPFAEDGKDAAKSDPITMAKTRISLRDALMELCQLGGMKLRVDDAAVALYPAESAALHEKEPVQPEGEAADLARKLVIPRIKLEETTLKEAVDFLNLKVREMREEEPFVPIVFAPGADPTVKIKSLRLRYAPLSEMLRYCTEATGHRWVAAGKDLRVERR